MADTLKLNLIELGRTGSKLITVVGRVDFKCPEAEPGDPVTFTTRDSYLVMYISVNYFIYHYHFRKSAVFT